MRKSTPKKSRPRQHPLPTTALAKVDAKGKKNYLQPPCNIPIAEITQGLLTLAGRLNVKTAKVIINSSLLRR